MMALASVLALGLAHSSIANAPEYGTSARGVVPDEYPGNFVSSDDDQVCYDMSELGYIGEVTGQMFGIKVDPPEAYNDGYVKVTLSGKMRYLAWEIENATMEAIIVKGGPNYHVYDYVGTGYTYDSKLVSPLNRAGNIPQISHYNICYSRDQGGGEEEGCTPGYWRNHADRWFGVAPGDDFDTTFGVDLFTPDITLGTAIWLGGGGANALARHATAALLNSYGGVPNEDGTMVSYRYTPDEVLQMVKDAVTNDTIEATKDLFEEANELGCPLSGTSAVKVK